MADDNIEPRVITRPDEIKKELVNQIDHPVLWSQTVAKIIEEYKVKRIIIFGPGKITQKIINDEYPDIRTYRVEDLQTLEETIEEIKYPGKKIEKSPQNKQPSNE